MPLVSSKLIQLSALYIGATITNLPPGREMLEYAPSSFVGLHRVAIVYWIYYIYMRQVLGFLAEKHCKAIRSNAKPYHPRSIDAPRRRAVIDVFGHLEKMRKEEFEPWDMCLCVCVCCREMVNYGRSQC